MRKRKEQNERDIIVEFLQQKALHLYQTTPGLLEVRYAEDPDRIIMTFSKNPEKEFKLTHKGKEIKTEIEVKSTSETISVSGQKDGKPVIEKVEPIQDRKIQDENTPKTQGDPIPESVPDFLTKEQQRSLGINEVLKPPFENAKAPNKSSFEKWQDRHKAIKRGS